jgi:hypothetical protein
MCSLICAHDVGVFRYRGAPPEDCKYLLNRLGGWLSGPDFDCPPGMSVAFAIIRAVLAHLYLAWIHPFGDGNGRTARLVEVCILISSGVPAPAAHLLSNHYNLTRAEYYRQLDRASRSGGEIVPFLQYAVQGFLDGLRSQLRTIRQFQLELTWRNYVYEQFSDKKSAPDRRKRDLVLDLSASQGPVPLSRLPEVSTRCAVQYKGKTRMTVKRDVKQLLQQRLIVKEKGGYVANKGLIEAFLPQRAESGTGTVSQ